MLKSQHQGLRMLPRKNQPSNGINFNDLQMNYTPAPIFNPQTTANFSHSKPQSAYSVSSRMDGSPMKAPFPSNHSSYSQIPSTNQNFKVVIRTRPPLEKQIDDRVPFESIVKVNSDGRSLIIHEYLGAEINEAQRQRDIYENPHLIQRHTFSFDRVYDVNSTQHEVYTHTAQQAVISTLEGYNASILAYGQTGTGKTHTMEGFRYSSSDPQRGIIPRCMEEIFRFIQTKSAPQSTFMVRASYLQIYNEVISDLLKNDRTSLALREDKKRGVFVEGLSEWAVRSPGEIFSLLQKGAQSRATASTKMNDVSSRSHAVFIIIVEQMTIFEEGRAPGMKDAPKQIKVGKLNLVDLAGSERVRVTGATGKRLEESKSINQSLSCLGNVISALTDSKGRLHIPYRDSKLTRLLEDSLGGNCKTTMMAMISPTHEAFSESMSTLKFATRAKKIKNEAHINEDVDQRALLRKYEIELKRLKDVLAKKTENIVNNERMMQLEDEKRRAEEDKAAAITALEARSREFVIQKEEKKKLEEKIRFLGSQVLIGGKKIEDLPQFRSALQAQQRLIREEYQGKLADIERERHQIEEDKAQVDRYKQLLLKQRDIMIALTARLNERDETIIQLQEELDAYDCIHKESEESIELHRARINQLEQFITSLQVQVPENNFTNGYEVNSGPVLRKYPPSRQQEQNLQQDGMPLHLLTADEKVEELNQIIQEMNLKLRNGMQGQHLEQIVQQRVDESLGELQKELSYKTHALQESQNKSAKVKKQREAIANILEKDINGLVKDILKQLQEQENPNGLYNINQQLSTLQRLISISANGIRQGVIQSRNEEVISLEGMVQSQKESHPHHQQNGSLFEAPTTSSQGQTNLRYHKHNNRQTFSNFDVLGVRNASQSHQQRVIPFNGYQKSKNGYKVHEMVMKRKQDQQIKNYSHK